jgi:hypothetical protein
MKPFEFWWDRLKHEDMLFTNRGSVFLVGQAMLLAAYAVPQMGGQLPVVCSATGVVVTAIWYWVNNNNLRLQRQIKEQLTQLAKEAMPGLKALEPKKLAGSHLLMGRFLPGWLLVVWVFLLVSAIEAIYPDA